MTARPRWVALVRGINVGRAKRVAMSDLRALVADLGYGDVRTLLNSGNVVFTGPAKLGTGAASAIEDALAERTGVSARVTLISGAELASAVAGCPLADVATDPRRLQVAFLRARSDVAKLGPLADRDWSPEVIAVGDRLAYLWCPAGVADSPLWHAVTQELGEGVTTRNWATVMKLHALAGR